MRSKLEQIFGPERVIVDAEALVPYGEDITEADQGQPGAVVQPVSREEVQAVVRLAGKERFALVPRVAALNVGGLAIPRDGAVVVDFTKMNRILACDRDAMILVIEPGVTQQDVADYLERERIPLRIGYSLAPPETSVLANCVMDGLTNLSLRYGSMGEWIAGMEVVLHDGTLVRTGAWAISDVPYGVPPVPGLNGLFVGWLGTTGIVTSMAVTLWPDPPCRRRLFVMAYSHHATFETVRRLCRLQVCDDIGGLSWPSGKMMLGVDKPHPVPQEGEPTYFLYVDLSGCRREELDLRMRIFNEVLEQMRAEGHHLEEPLDVQELVGLDPALGRFAHFPTRLEFLMDHPGGGLTWVGTYGPLARFETAIDDAIPIMTTAGFPPTIVTRPMKGGHFGVLRFVMTFDRNDPEQRRRVRETNRRILESVLPHGFVMYKPPDWAAPILLERMHPGTRRLMQQVKGWMDPHGILNPQNWGLQGA